MVAGPGLDVGVFRTVDYPRHILQVHGGTVLVGNDQLAVFLGMEQLVVGGQGGDARLAVQCTLGQVEAGLLDRQADVGQGQANGRQFVRRSLDPDRRALLAGDVDLADPVDLADLSGQQGFRVVTELGAGHLRRTDAEDQHRAVRRVDLLPGGQGGHVLGQLASGGVDRRLHFLGGGVDALVQGELQGQQGRAQGAAGGHLGHAGNGAELHLQGRGHGRGHGVRAGTGQGGGHLDGRELGLWQRSHRQAREGNGAQQHQGEGQQDGGNRMVDAPGGHRAMALHGWGSVACTTWGGSLSTWTWEPGLSRDWPSLTSTSPAWTPEMMFNPLS